MLSKQVAEQTRQHQERVAAATETDAEGRRIIDYSTTTSPNALAPTDVADLPTPTSPTLTTIPRG